MQAVNRYTLPAMKFTTEVFELNKPAFDNAVTEDVVFDCEAELVDGDHHTKQASVRFEGKANVTPVFARRLFDITSNVKLGPPSFQYLGNRQMKVDFVSVETKKEKDGPKKYHYVGHYILTFAKLEDGAIKVSKIDLKNTRTVLA
jgi:hypothetical protein